MYFCNISATINRVPQEWMYIIIDIFGKTKNGESIVFETLELSICNMF